MLTKIQNLPPNVLGVRAEGKVTQEDYETVLNPLLEEQHRLGQRIRFLYHFGPNFTGFTAGAALDDFRVGLKYLRLFERCAIVSDTEWIRNATQFVGSLMPCVTQVYKNEQMQEAISWLSSADFKSNLKFELDSDGVLIIQPQGPLSREDFDKLTSTIDPWIETHNQLHGLVINIEKFPGWENIGSFIHHMQFINAHHRKVRRVAIAMDGTLPEIMSELASHFVEAKIKQFPYNQFKDALEWAKS